MMGLKGAYGDFDCGMMAAKGLNDTPEMLKAFPKRVDPEKVCGECEGKHCLKWVMEYMQKMKGGDKKPEEPKKDCKEACKAESMGCMKMMNDPKREKKEGEKPD